MQSYYQRQHICGEAAASLGQGHGAALSASVALKAWLGCASQAGERLLWSRSLLHEACLVPLGVSFDQVLAPSFRLAAEEHYRALVITDASGRLSRFCQQCTKIEPLDW